MDVLYSEPDGSAVLGSFLHHTIDVPKTPKQIKARKKESELKECEKPESSTSVKCKDIRAFFKSTTTVKNRDTPPATTTPSVVRIDLHYYHIFKKHDFYIFRVKNYEK